MTYGEDKGAPADARSAGVASTARPGRRIADHAQIARQLATRPYEWGTVAVYRAAYVAVSTAGFIRAASGTFRVYGPAGSFETRATPVEDGTLLEARYVRGIARPLPGLIVGLPCTERDGAGQREPAPPTGIATVWPDALTPLHPASGPNGTPMTTIALLHDPYIDAVTEAIDQVHGLEVQSSWTSAAETVGTWCYLTGLISLDVQATGLETEWPNGLLVLWEWHSGREEGGPSRGPRWHWAEVFAPGRNDHPQDLPVEGYASPAAVVTAVRNLLAGDKTTLVAGEWDGSAQLEKAATAWDAEE